MIPEYFSWFSSLYINKRPKNLYIILGIGEHGKYFPQLRVLGISKIQSPIPASSGCQECPGSGQKGRKLLDLHSFERPGADLTGQGYSTSRSTGRGHRSDMGRGYWGQGSIRLAIIKFGKLTLNITQQFTSILLKYLFPCELNSHCLNSETRKIQLRRKKYRSTNTKQFAHVT